MDKTLYIPIDTTIKNTVECPELVKRGDTILLNIKVFTKAVLTDLTGQSIDIILKKSDGTRIERAIDTSNISSGIVAVKPGQQSTLVEGKVNGELQIYTNDTLSSTNTFTYNVDASLADDILIASQDDIQVLADLRNLIASGEVTIKKYEDTVLAIGNSIEAVEALANIKAYIDTNLPALENNNAQAVINSANLKKENDRADLNIPELKNYNDTADKLKSDLESDISTGTKLKSDLESDFVIGNKLKSDLENDFVTGNKLKSDIESDILLGNQLKSDLDTENVRAEANRAALAALGDVTDMAKTVQATDTEVKNARGGETDLGTRLNKFDTSLSQKAKQSDLNTTNDNINAIAVYNATCTYASNVFILTLANAPATLPNFYTLRFKAPSPWIDGSTVVIGSKTYTVANASFAQDEVTTVNFDEVASKCFFKSGGGGVTETLPQQVDTFSATAGDGVINLAWSNSNTTYLAGYYIVYKTGAYPTTINDGTKIDITSTTTTSYQITGLTNSTQYYIRIFPYNSKKQVQAQYKVATATPTANILIGNLSIGSKIQAVDPSAGNPIYLVLLDKNHTGFPSNSVTLMCASASFNNLTMGATTYQSTNVDAWLNDSVSSPTKFFLHLPTYLRNALLDTTVITATSWGSSVNLTRKAFILSIYELGRSVPQGTVNEGGAVFSYFTSDTLRKDKDSLNHWARTPGISTGGATGYFYLTLGDGTQSSYANTSSAYVQPVVNISSTANIYVKPTPNANGYYEVIV